MPKHSFLLRRSNSERTEKRGVNGSQREREREARSSSVRRGSLFRAAIFSQQDLCDELKMTHQASTSAQLWNVSFATLE